MGYGDRLVKNKRMGSIIISGVCIQIAVSLLSGCGRRDKTVSDLVSETSIFSWEEEYLRPELEAEVEKAMEKLGCIAIYQQISSDTKETIVLDYLRRRQEKKQLVYYLAGAAEWGMEENGKSMLDVVDTAAEWNAKAGEEGGFTGIVLDVEPYLLEEWESDQERCMKQYVTNCVRTYERAKEENLAVIVCIPNFYDRIGLSGFLEELIQNGCDGIAVMNYNKKDEAGQIEEELKLAQEYNKGIVNITEMQMQGYHGLTDENTYHDDGIEVVFDSWEKLKEQYPYRNLGFSWHYLKPCLELMETES